MPISNPHDNEYRVPCNPKHCEILKASFGKYAEFLKRNGAEKSGKTSEEDAYAIELEKVKLYLAELNKSSPPDCIKPGEAESKIAITGKQDGKGNYYKFLPDMFYLAYMQAKEGDGSTLDADKIFSQYAQISGKSVDELLEELKKENASTDDFNHNISAGVLRLLTFLQEKHPKIYNQIISKDAKLLQPKQRGGSRKLNYAQNMFQPMVKQENAWRKVTHDYSQLSPKYKSILPPPPSSPIVETVEPLTQYIEENADIESLNEARNAVDLLAPHDLEELMRSDSHTSPMSRITPYYEKALPGMGTPWVPIMVRADVLSRVLKNRT
jgi:hypothetical protein